MDVEEAFRTVGEFGPYQKQAVAIIVLTQVGLFVFFFYLDFLVRWHVCVNTAANEEECRYVACSRRITIKIFKNPMNLRTPLGGRKDMQCTRVLRKCCIYGTFPSYRLNL